MTKLKFDGITNQQTVILVKPAIFLIYIYFVHEYTVRDLRWKQVPNRNELYQKGCGYYQNIKSLIVQIQTVSCGCG